MEDNIIRNKIISNPHNADKQKTSLIIYQQTSRTPLLQKYIYNGLLPWKPVCPSELVPFCPTFQGNVWNVLNFSIKFRNKQNIELQFDTNISLYS